LKEGFGQRIATTAAISKHRLTHKREALGYRS
jgi:hypothetical protein